MKVLLSPAKAIDLSNKLINSESSAPVFLEDSKSLVNKLKKMSSKKIGEMMHLSTDLSDLNYERFQKWSEIETADSDHGQAVALFNGEVYRGFNAGSLTEEQKKVAQQKIRILSGLYGILKPFDLIYPYRLEMGTKWAVTPKKKNLYQFWGSKIGDELKNEDFIINLASTEYFKAADLKKSKATIITPVFKEFKNGDYKVIMVFAKRARGSMARYIVDHNIENPELLKGFNVDGYRFDENLSKNSEWVFTR